MAGVARAKRCGSAQRAIGAATISCGHPRRVTDISQITAVAGANSGIGRATAVHLAQQGHTVFGTLRSLAKVVQLVAMDAADDDSVRNGFAEINARAGRVDNLVNNAGAGGNAVAEECPVSLYHEVMNANLYGVVRCIQAVLPQMRPRRSGTIVNRGSTSAIQPREFREGGVP